MQVTVTRTGCRVPATETSTVTGWPAGSENTTPNRVKSPRGLGQLVKLMPVLPGGSGDIPYG